MPASDAGNAKGGKVRADTNLILRENVSLYVPTSRL